MLKKLICKLFNLEDPNTHISAFAFKVGKEVEKHIDETTNNLNYENNVLTAKILNWRLRCTDRDEYDKYFGIQEMRKGHFKDVM